MCECGHSRQSLAGVFIWARCFLVQHVAAHQACFLFRSSTPQCNACPISLALTMHWGHSFGSLRCDPKTSTNFFFRLYNVSDRRFMLLPEILATLACNVFPLLSRELPPFHLKGAHYGFSLVYLSCWQRSSCALGPLLGKLRVA